MRHEMRNERIVTQGVRSALNKWKLFTVKAIPVMAQSKVVPSFSPFMLSYVEDLTGAMTLGHMRGIERTMIGAMPVLAQQRGLRLSVYEDAIEAQAIQLEMAEGSVRVIKEHYRTVAMSTMTEATLTIQPRLNKAMQEVVERGMLAREAIPFLRERLGAIGMGPRASSHLLETYYRTGVQTAYHAGRWLSAQDPAISSILWGYEYSTVGDDRVREEHAQLEGITLPKEHPFWQRYYPPNGWDCRCTALEIFSVDKAGSKDAPEGYIIKEPPKGLDTQVRDRRFDGNPGTMENFPIRAATSNTVRGLINRS
jgi:SPP1 gp7 family putative phage head morphogenesis protein